jgi:hypothetical protein
LLSAIYDRNFIAAAQKRVEEGYAGYEGVPRLTALQTEALVGP